MKGNSSPYLARRAKKLKCVKKDYQRKNLNNPFFHSQRQSVSPRRRGRRCFIIAGIFSAVALLIYLFFFSPLFSLRQIKIVGVSRIPEEKLAAFAWSQTNDRRAWFFKQKNLLFFQNEKLTATLNNNFSFDSLRVYKKWPHTLVISAGERQLAFIWRDNQGRNFSDDQGCLVRETAVTDTELNNYPLLEAITGINYLNSKDCLDIDKNYLQALFSLNEKMKNHPGLKVARFLLDGEFNTLKADLSVGPDILFNIKEDLDKQVNKLAIIKQEKSAEEFNRLEYIDLRYGDRVYFK